MERLLSKPEVLEITGLTYPTIWRRMREGTFPRSLVIGKGAAARVAWKESEVTSWLDELPRQRLKGDETPRRARPRLPAHLVQALAEQAR